MPYPKVQQVSRRKQLVMHPSLVGIPTVAQFAAILVLNGPRIHSSNVLLGNVCLLPQAR